MNVCVCVCICTTSDILCVETYICMQEYGEYLRSKAFSILKIVEMFIFNDAAILLTHCASYQ